MTDRTIRWAAYKLATSLVKRYGFSAAAKELNTRWGVIGVTHPQLHQVYQLASMFAHAFEMGKTYPSQYKD